MKESLEKINDLGKSVGDAISFMTSSELIFSVFLLIVLFALLRVLRFVFKPLKEKHPQQPLFGFAEGCIKAFLIITIGMKIASMFAFFQSFAKQILMSSSLLVVVLGFVFQEGLSNIVHGFILSVFKPFHIGDRVSFSIDGESFTGYIKSLDLRSTTIQNVINSTILVIPNSKMDLCVIQNTHLDAGEGITSFLDFSITYESNLQKAIDIARFEIACHPLVKAAIKSHKITDPVPVMVRNLGTDGIDMRAIVRTNTIEENFGACSDLRKALLLRFAEEDDVNFAYPHIQIVADKGK